MGHGKEFEKVREIHQDDNGFRKIKPCKNCYYPRKTALDETAVINGRKVKIENYINRSQQIGK